MPHLQVPLHVDTDTCAHKLYVVIVAVIYEENGH